MKETVISHTHAGEKIGIDLCCLQGGDAVIKGWNSVLW